MIVIEKIKKHKKTIFNRKTLFLSVLTIFTVLVFSQGIGTKAVDEGKTKVASTTVTSGAGCYGTSWVTVEYLTADKTSGSIPLTVTFTATVYGYNPPFYYNWDFDGDGTWDESGSWGTAGAGACTAYTATHTYTSPKVYNVTFGLTDGYGFPTSRTAQSIAIDVFGSPSAGGGSCGNGTCDTEETSSNCPEDCSVDGSAGPNENYNYTEDSILVFTETESEVANVSKGSEIVYKMTVSNPHWEARGTKLSFSLPEGFTFSKMISSDGASIRADGKQTGDIGPGVIRWDYMAQPGEHYITFAIRAP